MKNGVEADNLKHREVHVGDVIQAAIEHGLPVESVIFSDGSCLDIGTPHDLFKAAKEIGLIP